MLFNFSEVFTLVISATLTLIATYLFQRGSPTFIDNYRNLVDKIRVELFGAPPKESYSQRLSKLMETLTKSSAEVDSVLAELAELTQNREKNIQRLEVDLA